MQSFFYPVLSVSFLICYTFNRLVLSGSIGNCFSMPVFIYHLVFYFIAEHFEQHSLNNTTTKNKNKRNWELCYVDITEISLYLVLLLLVF